MAMLTCEQMTALVTDDLEGRLSFIDRVWFRIHICTCRHCRGYLRQMKLCVAVLGEMRQEPVPDDVVASLLARFHERGG
jgi:predicted anti-sigma-YlaC factor YlaD